MTNPKLFAVYVGGKTETSNIELHDMRFVVGEKIEDCYDELRRQWWGTPQSIHLDAWGALEQVDGFDVSLEPEPYTGPYKLYFLNLGGYDLTQFTELHSNVFIVAESEVQAKVKALKHIAHWHATHKDSQFEIESTFCLSPIPQQQGLYVHLTPAVAEKPFTFVCEYKRIHR